MLVRFGRAPEATKSLSQEISSSHVFQVHCHISLSLSLSQNRACCAFAMCYTERTVTSDCGFGFSYNFFVLLNTLEHTKPHADYDRLTILILPNSICISAHVLTMLRKRCTLDVQRFLSAKNYTYSG